MIGWYYIFDTRQKHACRVPLTSPRRVDHLAVPFHGNVLELHDLGRDPPMTPNTLPTVLAISLQYNKYREFMKSSPNFYFVSLPTDAEMDFMAKNVFSGLDYSNAWPEKSCKNWKEAAYYYGNVPRYIFSGQFIHSQLTRPLNNFTVKD